MVTGYEIGTERISGIQIGIKPMPHAGTSITANDWFFSETFFLQEHINRRFAIGKIMAARGLTVNV